NAGMKNWGNGDAQGKVQFREGVDFVKKSVAVNPDAHFGRETWQVVMGEFILAAMEKPDVLKQFDFIGTSLTERIDGVNARPAPLSPMGWGHYSAERYAED